MKGCVAHVGGGHRTRQGRPGRADRGGGWWAARAASADPPEGEVLGCVCVWRTGTRTEGYVGVLALWWWQ